MELFAWTNFINFKCYTLENETESIPIKTHADSFRRLEFFEIANAQIIDPIPDLKRTRMSQIE